MPKAAATFSRIVGSSSPGHNTLRTTQLCNRRRNDICLDEAEKIGV